MHTRWCQEDWAKPCNDAQHQDKWQWAQPETLQGPCEYEEKLFYFEGYRGLEEVAWSACGVSSRSTQNPPQQDPVQSALGESVLAAGWN